MWLSGGRDSSTGEGNTFPYLTPMSKMGRSVENKNLLDEVVRRSCRLGKRGSDLRHEHLAWPSEFPSVTASRRSEAFVCVANLMSV